MSITPTDADKKLAQKCAAITDKLIRADSDFEYGDNANWSHDLEQTAKALAPIIATAMQPEREALRLAMEALRPLIRCGVPDANPSDECSITVLVSELEVANEALAAIEKVEG